MDKLHIGTSGWIYPSWKGKFYPNDLAQSSYLEFYAQHFNSVELNYSFYRLPKPSNYENWALQIPKRFVFAIKLSRFISHVKRLNNVESTWQTFIENSSPLSSHRGPILVQLPENFHLNIDRLHQFLEMAYSNTPKLKLVCEFRHPTWFVDEVYNLLSDYGAALCIGDSPKYPRHDVVTAKFVYYRFHGRSKLFASNYSKAILQQEAN